MTITRGPGIYFSERTTTTNVTYDDTTVPLFIIQTSTSINGLDDTVARFDNFDTFKTLLGNNLPKTKTYIEDILIEAQKGTFYAVNLRTDTATNIGNILRDNAHLQEITDVVYIEETKSSGSNTITQKIGAIKTALTDNFNLGTFRVAYIIPYGTVSDAVGNVENGTSEAACITSLTSITSAAGDGRVCVVVPDENAGFVTGHCIGSEYNEEVGFNGLNNIKTNISYNFNATQLLTICNLGVLVWNKERLQGVDTYRIYLGVTTSFKENKSDGYLVARRVADEMLRQIKFQSDTLVKDKPSASTLEDVNTIITGVISDFVDEEDVTREGTKLTATDNGDKTFDITGNITPTGTLVAIEVKTVLN